MPIFILSQSTRTRGDPDRVKPCHKFRPTLVLHSGMSRTDPEFVEKTYEILCASGLMSTCGDVVAESSTTAFLSSLYFAEEKKSDRVAASYIVRTFDGTHQK